MKPAAHPRRWGFTLVEMCVAVAVSSVVLAGAFTSAGVLQQILTSADDQATAQNGQLRLQDYLARDLKAASSAVISRQGAQLDLELPTGTAPLLQTSLRLPVLGRLLQAGASEQTAHVRYTLSGSSVYREAGGARTELASRLSGFAITESAAGWNVTASYRTSSAWRQLLVNPLTSTTQTISRP